MPDQVMQTLAAQQAAFAAAAWLVPAAIFTAVAAITLLITRR